MLAVTLELALKKKEKKKGKIFEKQRPDTTPRQETSPTTPSSCAPPRPNQLPTHSNSNSSSRLTTFVAEGEEEEADADVEVLGDSDKRKLVHQSWGVKHEGCRADEGGRRVPTRARSEK